MLTLLLLLQQRPLHTTTCRPLPRAFSELAIFRRPPLFLFLK